MMNGGIGNKNRIIDERSTNFARLLENKEIKEFLENRYHINIDKVERANFNNCSAVTFSISGSYTYAGFTKIGFSGVFYAYDYYYEFRCLVEGFKGKYINDWQKFMYEKFGDEYLKG